MKKNHGKKFVWLIVLSVVLMAGCSSSPKTYPYFITGVKPGGQNEWAIQNISEPNATGTIYTQLVPLTERIAAIITVGKINNMLVAQVIVTIRGYSRLSWSYIELENMHFDARTSNGISDAIYISIVEPKEFIKALQQKKIYDSELMLDMNIYRCKINGNLDLF
jgi:hypothetical protein